MNNKWNNNNNNNNSKEKFFTAASNRSSIINTDKKQQKPGTRNGKKTAVWIFQATNKLDSTQEDRDMAKKGKSKERNWISSNRSTKQRKKTKQKKTIEWKRKSIRRNRKAIEDFVKKNEK